MLLCHWQVTLRDELKRVVNKKRMALQRPLTLQGLRLQVCDVLAIPRAWDFQCYFGDDEDRHNACFLLKELLLKFFFVRRDCYDQLFFWFEFPLELFFPGKP